MLISVDINTIFNETAMLHIHTTQLKKLQELEDRLAIHMRTQRNTLVKIIQYSLIHKEPRNENLNTDSIAVEYHCKQLRHFPLIHHLQINVL
jgi:hypothetical protein